MQTCSKQNNRDLGNHQEEQIRKKVLKMRASSFKFEGHAFTLDDKEFQRYWHDEHITKTKKKIRGEDLERRNPSLSEKELSDTLEEAILSFKPKKHRPKYEHRKDF